jgi:hypothetical protein
LRAAESEDAQAEMRRSYFGVEFQSAPELLRGFIDLILAGIGVTPKNMHGRGIRLHAHELLKNLLRFFVLMCARKRSTQREKDFGRIRMRGPGAAQWFERGLVLA